MCVAILAAVSGPYYATMVINAFELETVTLGRMTMPRFEKSQRVNDISLGSLNPYLSMAQRLKDFLPTAIDYYPAEGYSGIAWAGTMYPFVIRRRCTAGTGSAATAGGWRSGERGTARDGGMLILIWMFAAIINTTMVGRWSTATTFCIIRGFSARRMRFGRWAGGYARRWPRWS